MSKLTTWLSVAVLGVGSSLLGASAASAHPSGVITIPSSVLASDGQTYQVTNHLTTSAWTTARREFMLVWAGDESNNLPNPSTTDDSDFLAVVDVTSNSRHYGKVVNTVTIDSVFRNEPHHMQYQWHKGDKVYAGGLLSDVTYVFDIKHLPLVKLSGVVPGSATPCGSVPDAYQVLSDGSAYGTYMGGPDVTGPCTYSDGQTRVGNGFAGSPGAIVRISPRGEVLSQSPANSTESEGDPGICGNVPALPQPSCANPHGVALREDLNVLVTGDFAEPRVLLGSPAGAPITRDTVRVFDISDRDRPRLLSLSHLPSGPRQVPDEHLTERFGAMETALPHRASHRGAFATTLNGALYYAPDITVAQPRWREVYDDYNAFKKLFPTNTPGSIFDGASWSQVSADDRYVFRIVPGGGIDSPGDTETGLLMTLDVQALLAAGPNAQCAIDSLDEIAGGGAEADCPKLVSVLPIRDVTQGGAHWAVMDNFKLGRDGFFHETATTQRIAVSNYFVAATGFDGNHEICMFNVDTRGTLTRDSRPCMSFNRTRWPHGATGNARPHGILFAIADRDIR